MVYRQQAEVDVMKSAKCPECDSPRLIYTSGTLTCTNCGHIIGKRFNKFGAKKTEFKGKLYDSKYEASVATDLEMRKRAGDILDYETQYMVHCTAYTEDGDEAFTVKHKVDFRAHLNDGSFELIEAKGVETADYKFRRKMLETLWLPMHPDHTYTVIKQNSWRR
jgi:uncharacterized Zn finger protein (UPF0148 family)